MPGCPGTSSVEQAALKLTETHLPLPPDCWIKGVCHHHLADPFYMCEKYLSHLIAPLKGSKVFAEQHL